MGAREVSGEDGDGSLASASASEGPGARALEVWVVSMVKRERIRTAWRLARNSALRRAAAWKEWRERRVRVEEEA